jgi:hypothetical protein
MNPGRAEAQKRFREFRLLTERFGTQSRFGKRENNLKGKIMICHKKHVLLDFSQ